MAAARIARRTAPTSEVQCGVVGDGEGEEECSELYKEGYCQRQGMKSGMVQNGEGEEECSELYKEGYCQRQGCAPSTPPTAYLKPTSVTGRSIAWEALHLTHSSFSPSPVACLHMPFPFLPRWSVLSTPPTASLKPTSIECPFDPTYCISETDLCDGEEHCLGGWDEASCLRIHHPVSPVSPPLSSQIECPLDPTYCISETDLCDGEEHCMGGWDEANCMPHPCPPGWLKCPKTGYCTPAGNLCDGVTDCFATPEPEDEDPDLCRAYACPKGWRKCADGEQCVQQGRWCDGVVDCAGECPGLVGHWDGGVPACWRDCWAAQHGEHCVQQGRWLGYWVKAEEQCVQQGRWCDGVVDCADGSDEGAVCSVPDPKNATKARSIVEAKAERALKKAAKEARRRKKAEVTAAKAAKKFRKAKKEAAIKAKEERLAVKKAKLEAKAKRRAAKDARRRKKAARKAAIERRKAKKQAVEVGLKKGEMLTRRGLR
ncbi:unnamed protein product [Closterium sp. Naga37s-1]|nr:unnamed protein product [Closterium sp. Naga37s-1]